MHLFTTQHSTAFRLLLAAAVILFTWQTLTPHPVPLPIHNGDKLAHAGAFFALAFLVDGAWPNRPLGWRMLLLLTVYGGAIELAQHYVPNRDTSALDLAADVAGLLLYAGPVGPWLRRRDTAGRWTDDLTIPLK